MIAISLVSLYLLVLSLAVATAKSSPDRRTRIERHVTRTIVATQHRQLVIGVRPSPTRYEYKTTRSVAYLRWLARRWDQRAETVYHAFVNPPHRRGWLCIHHFEGSWSDAWDPYWGGLQMDRSFMRSYAPRVLLRRGWANVWTPLEQMWVAERAHRSGRGYGPWPNTARSCGLLG